MPRLSTIDYFLGIAHLVAQRSTCIRRQVGCVLVNDRNHILATGYNGVPAGFVHCTEMPCSGADCESGTGLDLCEAIHAEQNALLQCRNVYEIHTCYVTTFPCIHCIKMLLNTSTKTIIAAEGYPHEQSKILWQKKGHRSFVIYGENS